MGTDDDSLTVAICTCEVKHKKLKPGALNLSNWVDNAYYRALETSLKHPLGEHQQKLGQRKAEVLEWS